MLIEVTEADIEMGKQRRVDACPIALALERTSGRRFYVRCDDIVDAEEDKTSFAELPEEAVEFIQDFDEGHEVHPFSFHLDLK